ncbi:toxin-antitoxin system HicB family antitoxin [Cohnella nanjingensis]|uniref:Ribbon-helix-helix protein, CopG family n=1 Tax=Cohnella nanjingensis TaxID=1387779 RepID=A0A7X0RSA6_9BACL|nr:ribbon-helix-helix protein, CopG family [Cohnella nanjingensis]
MNSNRSQLTLRITSSLDEKLSELSQAMGVSKNAFILMILNKEVKQ